MKFSRGELKCYGLKMKFMSVNVAKVYVKRVDGVLRHLGSANGGHSDRGTFMVPASERDSRLFSKIENLNDGCMCN